MKTLGKSTAVVSTALVLIGGIAAGLFTLDSRYTLADPHQNQHSAELKLLQIQIIDIQIGQNQIALDNIDERKVNGKTLTTDQTRREQALYNLQRLEAAKSRLLRNAPGP